MSREVIQDALLPVWPKRLVMSKQHVYYIRARVQNLLPVFNVCRDFDEFCEKTNITDISGGIDDEYELNDDDAYAMAREACETILGSHNHKDSLFSILDYLELIAQHAKGFSFEKITSGSVTGGSTKELLGVLWMTATIARIIARYRSWLIRSLTN